MSICPFRVAVPFSRRSRAGRVVAAGIVLLLAAGAAPRRDGPRFDVGSGSGSFRVPRVAMNEAGRMAVVWNDGGTGALRLRAYAPDGTIAGEAGLGPGADPDVALDERGNIAAVWARCAGAYPDSCTAYGRLFDAAAAPLGAEFALDPASAPGQGLPIVARERSGRILLGWTVAGRDGFVRLADSDGTWIGPAVRVGDPAGISFTMDAAVDASGEYVVLERHTRGRRYDRNLVPQGAPFGWTPGWTMSGDYGHVARSPDGPFVVGWRRYVAPDETYEVRAEFQRYDAEGQPAGAVQLARSGFGYYDESTAPVAASNRGDFVIVWAEQPASKDAWMRAYDGGGAPATDAVLVSDQGTAGTQRRADAGMNARGDSTIVYEDSGRIVGQRYCASLSVSAPVARAACVGGTASFAVQATGRLPLAYTWRKDGVPLVESARVRGTQGPILVLDPVVAGDAGAYDCVVGDACPAVASATSPAAALTIAAGAPLGAVANVRVARGGGPSLTITWDDVAGATDYVVTEDVFADGGFVTTTGTAASGAAGLTIPLPRSERFYRVAARNAACGSGAP